jgi:hypothetical protein
MVRALLDGRKTQTRRLLKLSPPVDADMVHTWFAPADIPAKGIPNQWAESGLWAKKSGAEGYNRYCGPLPYRPDDRLYVREAIRCFADVGDDAEFTYLANGRLWQTGPCTGDIPDAGLETYFRLIDRARKADRRATAPSIHMPRWASRLWLQVTEVRVQRVAGISEADALAEGIIEYEPTMEDPAEFAIEPDGMIYESATAAFRALWNSLHTEPGETWADNPWVVAVTFEVTHGNIDRRVK